VAGWTIRAIGTRYNLTSEMVRKSLTEWRVRAISSGYIQEIGPEVLPVLESQQVPEDEVSEDSAETTAEAATSPRPIRAPLQVVPVAGQQPGSQELGAAGAQPDCTNVLYMLLEEIEAEVEAALERGTEQKLLLRRLLELLKQECVQCGMSLSAVQAERLESVIDTHPEQARDLLRDLRNRVTDEERCTAVLSNRGPGRAVVLHVFLSEIETTVRERGLSGINTESNESRWPRHSARFLRALKEGCMELGMEFSLAQVKRIESALASDPQRMGDLLRDLRNRMVDEQERSSLICVARNAPRQRTAGNSR
jgi:hypothetical protein